MLWLLTLLLVAKPEAVDHKKELPVFQYKSGVVCIETRTSVASYGLGRAAGTGFFLNKKKGYVITNQHVARGQTVSSVELITSKGRRRMDAKHVYTHPFLDFCILKIDPTQLKDDVMELEMETALPQMNEDVWIFSNSEVNNFSIHKGQIANLFESMGHFPVQAFRISVVARGGASGAPVLNRHGKVIGLVFAGSTNSLWAIPTSYIHDVLKKIEQGEKIKIVDTGMILSYISIDEAIDNYKYPENEGQAYIKQYPNSFNRVLIVQTVMDDGAAKDKLQPGDIIHAVNDKEIGPSHYLFDKLVNAGGESLKISVWRQGKLESVALTFPEAFQIKRYLKFGGVTICEADAMLRYQFGIPSRMPVITQIEPGSMMYDIFPPLGRSQDYAITLNWINTHAIKDFDTLEAELKKLLKASAQEYKDYNVQFRNYGVYVGFDNAPILNKYLSTQHLSFKTPKDRVLEKYEMIATPEGNDWKLEVEK